MYNEAVLTRGARHNATVEELAAIAEKPGRRRALRDTFHRVLKTL
jgi:hypothetical protein